MAVGEAAGEGRVADEGKAWVEGKVGVEVKAGAMVTDVQGYERPAAVVAFRSDRPITYLIWTVGAPKTVPLACAPPPTVSVKLYFLR